MGEVIVITSGKGGVGKTTTVANVGTALSLRGKKTVVLDADIGLRNLDVVEGVCKLKQALIKDKRFENLYLIPAAQTRDKNAVSPEQMKELCDQLRESFDYVLIDCPAGIERGFKNAIAGADRAIVITNPEVSAVRDADRIIGLLEANEITDVKLAINRVRHDMVERGDMMGKEDIVEILRIELLGIIPDDEAVIISTNKGEAAIMDPKSKAGQAYKNIAARIMGEEVPLLDLRVEETFLQKLKRVFSK